LGSAEQIAALLGLDVTPRFVLFPLSRAVLTLLVRFDVGFGEPDRAQPVIGEDPYLIVAVGRG